MACIVRLEQSFTYRGVAERYSNKYHLTGGTPASQAEWDAIVTALATAVKAALKTGTSIVYAAGYTGETGAAVFTKDYTVSPNTPIAGTYAGTSGILAPGDAAAWIRWWAGQTNERGKKIYLRKYFHQVALAAGGGDTIEAAQKTAYGTLGALLVSGLTVTGYGGRTLCDKNGNAATSYNVPTYVTTRTLKRRSNSPL